MIFKKQILGAKRNAADLSKFDVHMVIWDVILLTLGGHLYNVGMTLGAL